MTSHPAQPPPLPPAVLRDACIPPGRALPPSRHGIPRTGFTCACCGREVVTSAGGISFGPATGSPRRFCSPACRQAALRRRRAGVAENTPPQRAGGGSRSLSPGPQDPAGKDTP